MLSMLYDIDVFPPCLLNAALLLIPVLCTNRNWKTIFVLNWALAESGGGGGGGEEDPLKEHAKFPSIDRPIFHDADLFIQLFKFTLCSPFSVQILIESANSIWFVAMNFRWTTPFSFSIKDKRFCSLLLGLLKCGQQEKVLRILKACVRRACDASNEDSKMEKQILVNFKIAWMRCQLLKQNMSAFQSAIWPLKRLQT